MALGSFPTPRASGVRMRANVRSRFVRCVLPALVLAVAPAHAQLNGENMLGDAGVQSGTQPAPGTYVSAQYSLYSTDTIRDAAGNPIAIGPGRSTRLTAQAFAPTLVYVSPLEIFGGQYGAIVSLTLLTQNVESSLAGLEGHTNLGLGDSYLVPAQLGWHLPRADAVASLGFYAPTGRYTPGGSDNLGLDMWSYELSGGGTLYLDDRKTLSFATTAFWELHSRKEDDVMIGPSRESGVRVGQLLTLEGGLGQSILGDEGNLGIAYYAQWKLTRDDFGTNVTPPPVPQPGKHRVWGFGPDVTLPIAAISASLNLRYLWETGARVKMEGQTLVITATFTLPSAKSASKG